MFNMSKASKRTNSMAAGKLRFPTIYECDSKNRGSQTVVADMDGTLLVGASSFGYFALIAFDVGGVLRLLLLLLASPFAALLYHLVSESAGIKVLIFATFAGVKVSLIKSAAAAVLPKHYSEDLHPETWRVFSSCGRKCVLTANPRIMVEPFLKNNLDVDVALGTEISSFKGFATGLVGGGGVLVGESKAAALQKAFGSNGIMPHIGIGDRDTDIPFMQLCEEQYMVPKRAGTRPVKPETLPKPVIFHDGRLVQKPTVYMAVVIIMYIPFGIIISTIRLFCLSQFPISTTVDVMSLLGCSITPKGSPPPQNLDRGVVFVSNHRTMADAVSISACLHRTTNCISYSVASFTEFISPIKVSRLTRHRASDAELMKRILQGPEGLLVMCPEGTTCREPYLLRFSALFAELTDCIVPAAVTVRASMFHGSTARGRKWLDPFFLYMNPFPVYQVTFLDMLAPDQTCKAGKSSFDVANNVQRLIGKELGYKCTNLTRKDKYQALAGTNGLVGDKPADKY